MRQQPWFFFGFVFLMASLYELIEKTVFVSGGCLRRSCRVPVAMQLVTQGITIRHCKGNISACIFSRKWRYAHVERQHKHLLRKRERKVNIRKTQTHLKQHLSTEIATNRNYGVPKLLPLKTGGSLSAPRRRLLPS